MSHTPGPWKAHMKRVYFGDNPIEMRSKEDAFLIAAAPDLLEACEIAIWIKDQLEGKWGYSLEEWDIIEKAIAKAKGE